jgi:transcription antitermination factor NusG
MNLADYTWHCLYCAPNRELATEHELWARRRMPTIVPAERQWRDKGRHTREVWRPEMPRYVFAGFQEAPNWEDIRTVVPYVQGYMQFGTAGPTKLRLPDVEWLFQRREALRGRLRPSVVEDVIRIGDKVKVVQGPFLGRTVTVDKVASKRIHAIMDFLGGPILFTAPLAEVARV